MRQAAVVGSFYPADPDELTKAVDTLLDRARRRSPEGSATVAPVALVARTRATSARALLQHQHTNACATAHYGALPYWARPTTCR